MREKEDIKIRRAISKDLDSIYALEVLSFEAPYPPWYLNILMALAGDLFFVATREEKVVGYTVALQRSYETCHLISIAVHPSFRRMGIGRMLLKTIEEKCWKARAKAILLEVSYKNYAAYMFYAKMGYKPFKILKDYYGEGKHAIAMIKLLASRW